MAHYIDADRLRAFKEALADTIVSAQGLPTYEDCKERAEAETDVLLATLFPLQQEQPEVDLEQELDQWRHEHFDGERDGHYSGEYLERSSQLDIARHFYELGRKIKEDK